MGSSRLLFFLAGLLVVEESPEVPNACGDDGADQRTDPVDPVVDREGAGSNSGTQASGRVQACTGVVDADQVSDEEGDTDTDWGKVVQGGLFDNSHQNGDAQNTGTEGFNHQASTLGAAAAEGISKQDWAWGHGAGGTAGSHAGNELGDHHAETLDWVDCSGKHEGEGDCWVQVTTGDSGGQEDADHDAEAETKGNHDDFGWVCGVRVVEGVVIGCGRNHVCTPEEDKGADELARDDHQQVLEGALERKAEFLVSYSSICANCGVAEALFWVHCVYMVLFYGKTEAKEEKEAKEARTQAKKKKKKNK
ncbi:hypothetical protein PMKS-003425 [Pichia membranifaciens]|uniref:Uncharacterized protein n=1 Tax=Pichia membranifaciens TaxID=4926 RepID=A0A1Q2YK49_9ASCO|nr:hypothetical protein PMKS-003425 [Pichia membranifaciens]